jgi:hypothetical protein
MQHCAYFIYSFICSLFNDALSVTKSIRYQMMNWKEFGRKWKSPNFKIPSWHSPGRTEKRHENLSQDSRSPGRGLNPGPPKYEARVLTTQPWRLLHCVTWQTSPYWVIQHPTRQPSSPHWLLSECTTWLQQHTVATLSVELLVQDHSYLDTFRNLHYDKTPLRNFHHGSFEAQFFFILKFPG